MWSSEVLLVLFYCLTHPLPITLSSVSPLDDFPDDAPAELRLLKEPSPDISRTLVPMSTYPSASVCLNPIV